MAEAAAAPAAAAPTDREPIPGEPGWTAPEVPEGSMEMWKACWNGEMEAIDALLAKGVSAEVANAAGAAPLLAAAYMSQADVVERLLKAGASVNHRSKTGQTALMSAITAPSAWIKERATKTFQMIVDAGASLTDVDESGNTPLHMAAFGGHVEKVRLLVSRGADVKARNKMGKTPYRYAQIQWKERRFAADGVTELSVPPEGPLITQIKMALGPDAEWEPEETEGETGGGYDDE